MLKGWQEALLKEKKSSMELEGLILHLIEAETTAEVVYLAEEQRKYIQFHQKGAKNMDRYLLDKKRKG